MRSPSATHATMLAFAVMTCLASCGRDAPTVAAPGPTTSAVVAAACPAPKTTTDTCAAVMTYVKNSASGSCCAYGSPCVVPIDGPQYSDSNCASLATPAAAPAASAGSCPPPKVTTDPCAAVMTYVKSPAGSCCAYASPCAVPVKGRQYADSNCTSPAGK